MKLTAAQALALAQQALDRGEAAAAEQICRRLLAQQATRPEAWYLLGAALQRQRRPAEALACFDTLLEQQPAFAPGHQRRGTALKALGRLDEALASLARALALQPDYPQAHCNRGNVLLEMQQFERALQAYDEALRQHPDLAPARSNRQLALHGLGNQHLAASRWSEALQCFDALLAGDAGHVDALCNRGTALQGLGRLDEAIAAFEQALEQRPGDAQLHFNLANALHAADAPARALVHHDIALKHRADHADTWLNRGNALSDLLRDDDAAASYDRALALRPLDAETLTNQAHCALVRGRYAEGWRLYESRWQTAGLRAFARAIAAPRWQGHEPVADRSLLLHAEQGLGDTLQFVRYAPLLAARGARVTLEVAPALRRLLATLPGVQRCIERGEPPPPTDFHCPLLSLPLAFGTTPDTIPSPAGYLHADAALRHRWRERLGADPRPRIGLMWSGGHNPRMRNRSLPLEAWAPLFGLPARFVSLHKEVRASDAAALARLLAEDALLHFGDEQQDLADAAAITAELDLVISVDTSIAHLAGALGKPVWVLLPHASDWRWLRERDDSPWYASARLFRQPQPGDWAAVIDAVVRALQGWQAPTTTR